ncbi:MAG: Ldh family oxidoreductase [Verrucomicrobiales bacterium]|nr:Ldh family oxidoreductase [Verrucomicrobiales bacterium]
MSNPTYFVVSREQHEDLVSAAYVHRGYAEDEAAAAARMCSEASWHGIRTHNALKALHLDELFGSVAGGCVPAAKIEVNESRFPAVQSWNANRKLGQAVACEAIETCIRLADEYGSGTVAIDNAFHYLWGGGYVMDAAKRGYIAYTNCTSSLAEVVPFGGKFPTLGTNPHSWGFPTMDAVGYPVVIDWATSEIAMGKVEQYKREGKNLEAKFGVDENGEPTDDPFAVKALLPFGRHKGYGLGLLNELYGAAIGGSHPTLRSRPPMAKGTGEKTTSAFYFQIIHPDAIAGGDYANGRTQAENISAVISDILGHGNENCMLPGTIEANNAKLSVEAGGLLFTEAEIQGFIELAEECGIEAPAWNKDSLSTFSS